MLVAAVGVIGTLGGVVFTQWRSDVRDQNRLGSEERREQTRLDNDAERERANRLFAHRRDAYLSMIQHYHQTLDWLWEEEQDPSGPDPSEDALQPFWRALSAVDLYCEPSTASLARDLYDATARMLYKGGPGHDERMTAAETAYREFLGAVRTELGVPALDNTPRPNWWEST